MWQHFLTCTCTCTYSKVCIQAKWPIKLEHEATKGPGKRGHIVVDTLLLMMFLVLRKLGNICCGHKMFLNKIRNMFCVRNKCCTHRQMGKHLCRQQCVRNNVSSFAQTLRAAWPSGQRVGLAIQRSRVRVPL